jgi:integrase/recombinase XerD
MDFRKWLERYSNDCDLKYGSEETRKNYKSSVKLFLEKFQDYKEPKEIPTEEIKCWLLEAKTINTRKQKLCAIKSFYELTIGMPAKISKIPYPKKERKLPIVLAQDEIQAMFNVCDNIKHKVILAILYSTGMRSSELINLRWRNIDRKRMIINIIAGKGKKDRQVMLSKELIPLLTNYWYKYKTTDYILAGQFTEKYSKKSVGEVIKQLAKKAGINKRAYTHLIRHCSFTHLVEAGTDINLIQKLAGHSSVKSTLIYTHISDNIISKINSPLNNIKL